MNAALLHKEVQEFIAENYKTEIPKIILRGSPFKEVSVQELAIQLSGKKKAEKKLPTWFKTQGILYPPTLNLEQTSSETTAAYKASLTSGKSLIDLTGGFGIDSYFFAKHFDNVIHCELHPSLSELVAHNNSLLKADNIEHFAGDGLEYLKSTSQTFDWIFLDPSRRDEAGGRVFHLSDCLPNVPEHLDLLLEKAPNVLVKTSPLLDLKSGILSLKKVKEIQIVAVNNEVKELLWFLDRKASEVIKIKTLNFKKKTKEVYENNFKQEAEISFSTPKKYLYEPNAAILKSGLFDAVGADFKLEKLHPNSHLYTSNELVEFPGRRFEVQQILPYSKKKLKRALAINNANLATRNFPESVAALRKQLNIKDGGEDYLFFTTTGKNDRIVIVCKKAD